MPRSFVARRQRCFRVRAALPDSGMPRGAARQRQCQQIFTLLRLPCRLMPGCRARAELMPRLPSARTAVRPPSRHAPALTPLIFATLYA